MRYHRYDIMLTMTHAPVHQRPVSSDSSRQDSFVMSQPHKMVCLVPDKYASVNGVTSQSC